MIRDVAKLDALSRHHDQIRLATMTYEDALRIFSALWMEARSLGWNGERDWLADLEPELALARALNDHPPRP